MNIAWPENAMVLSVKSVPAFFPKEITSFHSLLTKSLLTVTFTSDHEFLFAFNNRNRLVGGLFWKNAGEKSIHLEFFKKIPSKFSDEKLNTKWIELKRIRN